MNRFNPPPPPPPPRAAPPAPTSLLAVKSWRDLTSATLADHGRRFDRVDATLDAHGIELARLRAQVGVWAAVGAFAASAATALVQWLVS